MTTAYHKWHGNCDVLSADGKYCTIRFFDGEAFQVKRVQARMISAVITSRPNPCSCKTSIKRFGKCPYCHIKGLRKYATEIERLKYDIGNCLSEANKTKWDAMNSQQKKIAVFRAMELGFITWKITSNKNII